ncbi:hypothetical protein KA005_69025, partial [bacterium]|nr:hypothetical protein [bacterium]
MSHKKKLKLSPAMKMGMMLILLEGRHLIYTHSIGPTRGNWWRVSSPWITPRELCDGHTIPMLLEDATNIALIRRGLISRGSYYNKGRRLTKKGLYKIKQWPEYGE